MFVLNIELCNIKTIEIANRDIRISSVSFLSLLETHFAPDKAEGVNLVLSKQLITRPDQKYNLRRDWMKQNNLSTAERIKRRWAGFWMRRSSLSKTGRLAMRFASWSTPPHYKREILSCFGRFGYIAPTATLYNIDPANISKVFIDEYCVLFQHSNDSSIELNNDVRIYRNTTLETGEGGVISIGSNSSIHPRNQLSAYKESIIIGKNVMIAANCAFYPYDHEAYPDLHIREQPLSSKGPIVIEDEVWIGTGVIVLSGVTIGNGAVVGAGSVVTKSIPAGAIAAGNPARIIKYRNELTRN